ncbi:MAG: hypothetical protein EKK62_15385 [Acidimicrobiia bacterium]|nr:MAG: hypothetical protein EKK62_15385 [Acidimicrobiia bacterium]
MSAALPMMPSLFERALADVLTDTERQIMADRAAAGLEFAALMKPGGEIRRGGEWCEIATVGAGAGRQILLTLVDGREVVAAPLAQRRYREASA